MFKSAQLHEGDLLQCAICQKVLTPTEDMALVTFLLRRKGELAPTTYRVYACSSAHMAEALRRTADVVEQRLATMPAPGSADWPRQHGVLVSSD